MDRFALIFDIADLLIDGPEVTVVFGKLHMDFPIAEYQA